jgi:acyl-ACP thioesterase
MDQAWKYRQCYDVRRYEANASGSATVRTIANYMTDAAINNADTLGYPMEELAKQDIYWVLTNLYVKFFEFPKMGDRVSINTWASQVNRLFFRREFEVMGAAGQTYALAMSRWVLININNRKVERVPADMMLALSPEDPEFAIEDPKSAVLSQAESPVAGSFRVRLSDIDRNKHVSNVHYIDWVVESAPQAREGGFLSELEIQFKAEAVDKDQVLSRAAQGEDPSIYYHGLFNEADGREMIRAKTVWR